MKASFWLGQSWQIARTEAVPSVRIPTQNLLVAKPLIQALAIREARVGFKLTGKMLTEVKLIAALQDVVF